VSANFSSRTSCLLCWKCSLASSNFTYLDRLKWLTRAPVRFVNTELSAARILFFSHDVNHGTKIVFTHAGSSWLYTCWQFLTCFCSSCIVVHNVTFVCASRFCFCVNIRLVLLSFFISFLFYVLCSVTCILIWFLFIINQSVIIMYWMKCGRCTLVHINCNFFNFLLPTHKIYITYIHIWWAGVTRSV
jgi:hypothetical protein